MTTTNAALDLGNNESVSRGVFPQADGTFLAMTYTASKTFKTRAGAEGWIARRSAPGAMVTRGGKYRGGRYFGAFTRVALTDGRSVEFVGRMPKGIAVAQALEHFAREAAAV